MILRYRPKDGPEMEFEFVPGDLESDETEPIEEAGGSTWGTFEEWGALFFRGNMKARRAALWIFLKRENPGLRFQDVSFTPSQVDVDYSVRERNRILQVMLADPNLDPEQRTAITLSLADETELVSEVEAKLDDAGVDREGRFPKDPPA